ncbi:MAG: Competence protein, partial [Candidatus Levybacteria bacterium]|nr:Competence protein [Candidatus Levybacteria bacterium]
MNLKLLAFLLIILSFRFYFHYHNQTHLVDGQQLTFEASILSQPQVVGGQQVVSANYQNQKIKITTGRFPELNYGDSVRISGPVRILPQAGGLQPRALEGQSNGARKISNKNGRALMYFPKIEMINRSSGIVQSGLQSINFLRQKLITLFSKTLPSPSSSLLLGIIFGIKEQMPKDFSDNLRTAGVFHVIAASGMNVTLVGGFISTFFAFFLKRQIAIGLSILGILFYATLAGLEPSIIRASMMGILVFSAQILGRQTLAVNSLLLAGFGMIYIDPTILSDVGFQLSFAATAGILYIKPLFGKQKGFIPEIATTIAAQVATLPILLANFGTYSIYSILVNGLVLWTVPILMMIGGIGTVLGLILEPLGQFLIYLCYPLLLYFQVIINFFGKAGGVLTVNNFPW